MKEKQKVVSLIAFVMGCIELLIILFAPSFFVLMEEKGWSGKLAYSADLRFTESFLLLRGNIVFGIICGFVGIVFIMSVILTLICNLATFLSVHYSIGDMSGGAKISSKISALAIGTAIGYPLLISAMMGALFFEAELGFVSLMLLILINMFSKADVTAEAPKTEKKNYD